ncbi:deleted in malignant brain tumors 1 protein-like [Acipenser oxyrinchus oxyrinchus]|uniref:Deleted in malignant brain tumors 1 protein-like n=1 Tax=Acipenser oxyrinchus oxyrinchus TaxID=40147 RepID=A0AAD8D822_ACIOX|nr:deleted in malignant brain tumors 1 protein-like [Acipenser oxyrinchus oxyrinchus]
MADTLNIRLANGKNNCSGRVEFYYKDQWEAGCGDYWDMRHAQVVCRELGCGYAVSAPVGARFGNRTAPYWRKGFHCSGEEQSLISCSVNDLTTCHKDASVICSVSGAAVPVRLVNGNSSCSGRVEFISIGVWGAVCGIDWDMNEAEVVCRELGCGSAVSALRGSHFGEGQGPVWQYRMECTGRESSLERCDSHQLVASFCSQKYSAGAVCSGTISF